MAFLSRAQLSCIGFASLGENVLISDKASIYNPAAITIGNNVRVDDFVVLSAGQGGIVIGNYVHISVGVTLIGAGKITVSDFAGLSSKVSVFSSNDDYSGGYLTNPMVPDQYRAVTHSEVFLGRHVIVGAGSVLLPGVRLEDGVAVGALSFVRESCESFGIYGGNPARRLKERRQDLLALERKMISEVAKQLVDGRG